MKKNQVKLILLNIIIFSIFFIFNIFKAETQSVKVESPVNAKNLEEIIGRLIDFLFTLALAILPIIILVGAFMYMSSGGAVEEVNKAKRIIWYALIGFIIVLISKGLVSLIKYIFVGQ